MKAISQSSQGESNYIVYQYLNGGERLASKAIIKMDKYNLALFMSGITFNNYGYLNTKQKKVFFTRFIIDSLEGRIS